MSRNTSGQGRPPRHLVYQRLEEALADLRQRLGGLPAPAEAEDTWTSIWYQEAHHSTALEGNTLVLHQVEALLAEGRAVGNKELSEYMEVQGYATAAQWVYRHALDPDDWTGDAPLTMTEVRHVHELAMAPVWGVTPHPNARPTERPGSFREHDIRRFPGGMIPPPAVELEAAVNDWIRSLSAPQPAPISVERMAQAHGDFERIHPFLDGNGRTGRLLLNLLLVRSGYPPAIIYKRDRSRYLRALRRADGGDPAPLGELIARAVTDNLYRFIVPAVAGHDHLVPLAALASQVQTVSALRIAIERGRLRAQKGTDGQWRSTMAWLEEYRRSRYRRR
ncbi:MAG: Fic family protein [Candidatus Dormibacteria bacterium]